MRVKGEIGIASHCGKEKALNSVKRERMEISTSIWNREREGLFIEEGLEIPPR